MTKEQEIERIANLIGITEEDIGEIVYEPYKHIIQALVAVGIGDKKQAVEAFAEKLKTLLPHNGWSSSQGKYKYGRVYDYEIDELFTERYGADE